MKRSVNYKYYYGDAYNPLVRGIQKNKRLSSRICDLASFTIKLSVQTKISRKICRYFFSAILSATIYL